MPLRDLQIGLGSMLTAQAARQVPAPPMAELNLTAAERSWLAQLIGTPGFEVTCAIQRWWRETKLRWTARLTLAAIGPQSDAAMLGRYLDATPLSSLFFMPEALGFLDFAGREAAGLPHVAEIARFERALLIVKDAAMQGLEQNAEANEQHSDSAEPKELRPEKWRMEEPLAPHPAAALVELAAPPEELLGALIASRQLPPVYTEQFPVLIAPGLPHLWRPASSDEALLFNACQPTATIANMRSLTPDAPQTLQRLLRIGALQRAA